MVFNIRKPFARRNTDHPVTEDTGSYQGPQYDADGKAIPHDTNRQYSDDGAITSSVDQLKKFKKTHQWDYNLDYETIVRSSFSFRHPYPSVRAVSASGAGFLAAGHNTWGQRRGNGDLKNSMESSSMLSAIADQPCRKLPTRLLKSTMSRRKPTLSMLCSKRIPRTSRSGPQCETTMKKCQRTPSGRGSSD